jgi:dynactin complex subunit
MAGALKRILTLCLVLGLTSIAWGQGPVQIKPIFYHPVLDFPGVPKDLKLSDEQIKKLKDALGKVMEKHKDDPDKFQRMSPEEVLKQINALDEDLHKAVAGILDAKQMKRLNQIKWQIAGVGALIDPDLQKELKLSNEQKKKLKGIFNDMTEKWQQIQPCDETSWEKYQAILEDLEEKANGVLSEEQKKNVKELMGPPFELSPPPTPKK